MSKTEIKVRNLNPIVISKIDTLAHNKGVSRNQYLKEHIESLTNLEDLKEQEDKYLNVIELLTEVIGENSSELKSIRILLGKEGDVDEQ